MLNFFKELSTANLVTLIVASLAFLASIIGSIVLIFNARLAGFTRQKWWERKVEAYSRIIEALANLVYYYDENMQVELKNKNVSGERKDEMERYWKTAYTALKVSTAMGSFLVSKKAEKSLNKMWDKKSKYVDSGDWYGLMESEYSATDVCLKEIVKIARHDLGT